MLQLKSIMSNYDLVDIWRVCKPTLRQFTWRPKTPLQMSRLDFFLISNDLQFGVNSCENSCPLNSDHSPVKLKLRTDLADDRGRVYIRTILRATSMMLSSLIEVDVIGNSAVPFLKIINLFLT